MKDYKLIKTDSPEAPAPLHFEQYNANSGRNFAVIYDAVKTPWDRGFDPLLLAELQKVKNENCTIKMENQELHKKLQAVNPQIEDVIELRDISREQAKTEVTKYFKDHHGETVYPSDIAEALNLSYLIIEEIIEELENEGQVGRTP